MAHGYGLTSQEHLAFQSSEYEEMIRRILGTKINPVILDMCAGSGRDNIMMHDFALSQNLTPLSIAIDCDPRKYNDASHEFEGRFQQANHFNQVSHAHSAGKISYGIDTMPCFITALANQLLDQSLSKVKVDFMLCNAGIMFIQRPQLHESVQKMIQMLSKDRRGQLLLGFSTTRPPEHYGDSDQRYTLDEVDETLGSLSSMAHIEKLDDLEDQINGGRGFSWYYRLLTRHPK